MLKARVSLPAAAALILSSSLLSAQTAPAQQEVKPSPYEGVSRPPAAEVIAPSEQPLPDPAAAPVSPAPTAAMPAATPATPQTPATAPSAANSNPDAGIIESPLPPSADEYRPHAAARLHSRIVEDEANDNKEGGIVTAVPAPSNALPAGTVFKVHMLQEINASTTTANTPFRARLAEDLLRNGKVVVPEGSELHGRVAFATSGSRLGGGSVLHLRPEEFVLPDGTRLHLHAEVIDTIGSDTRRKGEGDIVANEHGKRTLAELGMGAGSGAILGGVVGGGVGAVVGTAVGAGIVTAHWLRTNWSANLPESSVVVFSLTDAMLLSPAQDQKTELLPQTF